MIFKTFNNDIDKWTAKIGIFGKSFNELGTAVNNAFKETIDNIDNFDDNVGFWESLKNNLFSKKDSDKDWIKNSLGEIISQENIDSYIAELKPDKAREKLKDIFDWKNIIDDNSNDKTWQDYFDTLKDGSEKYIPDLIKNTDDLSKLEGQDLVNACNEAREAALAHNAALKQQTLGAKALAVGMKVLSTALDMVAYALIAKGIELVVNKISDLKNASKEITKNAKSYSSELSDLQSTQSKDASTISSLSEEYENLSQGVNALGENVSLTSDEYDRYHDICNQIADIMPNLVSGYDEQGNAIINLKNNLSDLNKEYENKMLLEAEQAYNEKDEEDNYKRDSIVKDFDNFEDLDTSVKLEDTATTAEDYYDKLKVIATKSKEELYKIHSGDFTEMGDLVTKQIVDDYILQYGNYLEDMTDEEFEAVKKAMLEDMDKISNSLSTKSAQVSQVMMQYAQSTSAYYDKLESLYIFHQKLHILHK